MIEQDYIMRMISMLTAVIAKLLDHRKAHEFPEAISTIDKACKHLLGADMTILNALSDIQLIEFFGHDPNIGPVRWYGLGVLLQEKAEVDREMGRVREAVLNEQKALSLLLEALKEVGAPLQPDHRQRIQQSMQALNGEDLSPHIGRKIEWFRGWKGSSEAT
jgi:hypothetical protein